MSFKCKLSKNLLQIRLEKHAQSLLETDLEATESGAQMIKTQRRGKDT